MLWRDRKLSLHFFKLGEKQSTYKENDMKREYLTSDELIQIVNELVSVNKDGNFLHEKASEREILKVAMTAQCLCEEVSGMKTCNDMYDWYMEQDIDFDTDVKNYYVIDKLVKEELGIDCAVRSLIKNVENKMTGFNMNDTIEQLKGVVNIDNK